jgi:hypothetical protein
MEGGSDACFACVPRLALVGDGGAHGQDIADNTRERFQSGGRMGCAVGIGKVERARRTNLSAMPLGVPGKEEQINVVLFVNEN